MAKYKLRNLKVFKTNIWSFYQNILTKNGKNKLFLDGSSSEYYPYNLNLKIQSKNNWTKEL